MTSTKEYMQREDERRATRRRKTRCRKRLSTLLHTHVALILVCMLAALDATCVIGQIICDILIMKDYVYFTHRARDIYVLEGTLLFQAVIKQWLTSPEVVFCREGMEVEGGCLSGKGAWRFQVDDTETLSDWHELDENLTAILFKELPLLNRSDLDPGEADLMKVRDFLLQHQGQAQLNLTSQLQAFAFQNPGLNQRWLNSFLQAGANAQLSATQASVMNVTIAPPLDEQENSSLSHMIIGFFKIPVSHSRSKRAAGGGGEDGEHGLLHELTHAFHLGSMIILSILLLETLLKMFAMGKKVLHHKLEIFDAFVVSVSWALDVAFWEGIWAHPGNEAATILIFILPWRVVRIVNSFVLVIQEKDHVQLKIVKQRLRLSMKKSKESTRKASGYRTEVKQLQGLCRKYGATEGEITACGPTGRSGRRRSSLLPVMERAASLTLISALGSHPSLYTMDDSSDEEDAGSRELTRTVSQDPTLRSALSVSTLDSVDAVFTIEGKGPSVGESEGQTDGYVTSDNEDAGSADGLDNPVFDAGDESPPLEASTPGVRHRNADEEAGQVLHAKRLHQLLTEQNSTLSVESETNSSGSGADPANLEVPPTYHEVLSQQ
ncbi:hypothetical protein BaRGS_00023024, partial [Batillaria attramentaria]